MKYTKPGVLFFGPATNLVQIHTKADGNLDSFEPTYSTAAYEADE